MSSRTPQSDSDSASDASSESSQGWEDAPDAENESTDVPSITCLFCAETKPTSAALFAHCKESHDFDFKAAAKGTHRIRASYAIAQNRLTRRQLQISTFTTVSSS